MRRHKRWINNNLRSTHVKWSPTSLAPVHGLSRERLKPRIDVRQMKHGIVVCLKHKVKRILFKKFMYLLKVPQGFAVVHILQLSTRQTSSISRIIKSLYSRFSKSAC